MKLKRYHIFLWVFFLVGWYGCDLEKEVDIVLPDYDAQVMVECYLEPGKPVHLLLTRSAAYFDPIRINDLQLYLDDLLEQEAEVRIFHGNEVYILENKLALNPVTGNISNYSSPDIIPDDTSEPFELEIITRSNDTIWGETTLLTPVPFDSLVVEYRGEEPSDTLARVLTYLSDPVGEENFYRRMLHYQSQDSIVQDFLATDEFNDNNTIAFGTGFEFVEGDSIINTLYHIDPAYFDFLVSVLGSIQANANPFAQPGQLVSNVRGTDAPIGIFTGLTYVRDTTIIGPK